eukprot:m.297255 g.297255  ORF g.297255 m.297255 type:complete len:443 (-) comp13570_c0_seq1:266-1594(-)
MAWLCEAFSLCRGQVKHLQKTLSLEQLVCFAVDNITLGVLALFLLISHKGILGLELLDALPQIEGVVDQRDVLELGSVGNAKKSHAMCMAPLAKVLLKRLEALVDLVATDFARIGDVQAMQLVEPVRDWLAIPSKRKALGVVDGALVVLLNLLLVVAENGSDFLLLVELVGRAGLLALNVLAGLEANLVEKLGERAELDLGEGNALVGFCEVALLRLAALGGLGQERFVELVTRRRLGKHEALSALLQSAAALEAKSHQPSLEAIETEGFKLLGRAVRGEVNGVAFDCGLLLGQVSPAGHGASLPLSVEDGGGGLDLAVHIMQRLGALGKVVQVLHHAVDVFVVCCVLKLARDIGQLVKDHKVVEVCDVLAALEVEKLFVVLVHIEMATPSLLVRKGYNRRQRSGDDRLFIILGRLLHKVDGHGLCNQARVALVVVCDLLEL